MRIEPHIIDGPQFHAECEGYCHHQYDMQYIGIYWMTDDGLEYGSAAIVSLPISGLSRKLFNRLLWDKYYDWLRDEGYDESQR